MVPPGGPDGGESGTLERDHIVSPSSPSSKDRKSNKQRSRRFPCLQTACRNQSRYTDQNHAQAIWEIRGRIASTHWLAPRPRTGQEDEARRRRRERKAPRDQVAIDTWQKFRPRDFGDERRRGRMDLIVTALTVCNRSPSRSMSCRTTRIMAVVMFIPSPIAHLKSNPPIRKIAVVCPCMMKETIGTV